MIYYDILFHPDQKDSSESNKAKTNIRSSFTITYTQYHKITYYNMI